MVYMLAIVTGIQDVMLFNYLIFLPSLFLHNQRYQYGTT